MVTDQTRVGWARRVAHGAIGVGVVLAAAGMGLAWAVRGVALPDGFEAPPGGWFVVALLLFVGCGGLLAARRPGNPIGWLLLAVGVLAQTTSVAGIYRVVAWSAGESAPWAAWAWDVTWMLGLVPVFAVFLLFPDGRLPSRRWRVASSLLPLGAVVLFASLALRPGPLWNTPVANPIGTEALGSALVAMEPIGNGLFAVGALVALAAPWARYRRATRVQRYQLKWLLTAAGLVAVAWLTAGALEGVGADSVVLGAIRTLPLLGIPVAVAAAVLRYRLYEIDVVINRALLSAGLVGFVGLVYVTVVFGVGSVVGVRGGANVPLTVAATVLAAVAFQPARRRLQELANRVVYGQRASPYDVLASFTQRMGDAYPTGEAPTAMARAVCDSLHLARCDVWLHVQDRLHRAGTWPPTDPPTPISVPSEDVGLPGSDRSFRVRHGGALLGAIGITTAPGHQVSDAEDRLLRDLAGAAWLVLDNAQLLSELRSSRQRLVHAQDTQRRLTERDLHDGAQQRLLELALTLRMAHQQADEEGAAPAAGTIAAAELQLRVALGELRDLARGIHPAILTERGLPAALESLAERAPLPVTVTSHGVGRLSDSVEATAYFVAAEAMANIIKHAGAATASITLTITDGRLLLAVSDDGCGGADPSRSGLRGLSDRVGALDGRLDIASPLGGGTHVAMALPCG